MRRQLLAGLAATLLGLTGCATLPDPLDVTVAGIEPLAGEGMELRLLVKLRVVNPNDRPIEFDGASVRLDVAGRTFATGASAASGTVPRFGEAVVEVPVTVSMLRMARQVMGMLDGKPVDRIQYDLAGKLSKRGIGAKRFSAQGEFQLPAAGASPRTRT
jgi:LEA14-like dessication related protein